MRKCRNGLPVTIDREGQRLPRLRAQRPKRPRRECGVGRRESAKAGDQSLSNGPGTPQNLFCGEIVHFPPAESGQKGRRGAITPRAKCPPEPPVRGLRGRFLLHPSPAADAGLRFAPAGGGDGRRRTGEPSLRGAGCPSKKPPCLLDKAAFSAIMKVEGRCR